MTTPFALKTQAQTVVGMCQARGLAQHDQLFVELGKFIEQLIEIKDVPLTPAPPKPTLPISCFTWCGYELSCWKDVEGKPVFQLNTPTSLVDMAPNGQPVCRVNMNDARLWEGFADGSEEYGEPA